MQFSGRPEWSWCPVQHQLCSEPNNFTKCLNILLRFYRVMFITTWLHVNLSNLLTLMHCIQYVVITVRRENQVFFWFASQTYFLVHQEWERSPPWFSFGLKMLRGNKDGKENRVYTLWLGEFDVCIMFIMSKCLNYIWVFILLQTYKRLSFIWHVSTV